MNLSERAIESALNSMADAEDGASADRILSAVGAQRRRARIWRLSLFSTVVAACVASLVVTLNLQGGTHSVVDSKAGYRPVGLGEVHFATPGTPCPGVNIESPTAVAQGSQTPVFANPAALSLAGRAWNCHGTPVFLFGNVQVSYEDGWGNVDVASKLSSLAADWGGYVTTIDSLQAWVSPASETQPDNEVLIIRQGVAIKFLSPGTVPIASVIGRANALGLSGSAAN